MLESHYPGLGQSPVIAHKIFQRWVSELRDSQMGFNKERAQMGALVNSISTCEQCALIENCTEPFYGDQHIRSNMMIVGSHPEAEDIADSVLYTGHPGKVLYRALENIGAIEIMNWVPFTYRTKQDGIFLTTAVKCPPVSGKHPHVSELKACQKWLGKQIGIVRPRVIVAMGNAALSTLTGRRLTKCRISRERGTMQIAPDKKTFIMPTWDPGYVVHRMDKGEKVKLKSFNEFQTDLQQAWVVACRG